MGKPNPQGTITMKPLKSSKQKNQKNQKKSPISMNYVLIGGAVAIALVAVISIFLTANSRSSGGRIDEAEAQERWKQSVPAPTKKK